MSQTVLVADDSKTIRQIVEMALKASTWEVVGVDSAQDAMQAARQNPSVILLDYYMPDGSGYDVCRALKQDSATRTIPIVMLGGSYKAFDEDLARQAGADVVLMKPFKTDQLIGALEDAQKAETALPIPSIPEPEPMLDLESESEEYGYGAGDEESSEPIYTAPEPEPVFDPPTTEAPVYELPISEEESEPMPTPVPQPPSQPRIPVQPSRGSSPDIQPSREPVATPMPTPTPAPPTPTPTPAPTPQAAPAEPSISREEIETMIREEVKSAVRNELPGLLRNVMGEIFQNKILPKLMQHAEARVKSVVNENLATQIQSQVRTELERLLSEE